MEFFFYFVVVVKIVVVAVVVVVVVKICCCCCKDQCDACSMFFYANHKSRTSKKTESHCRAGQ